MCEPEKKEEEEIERHEWREAAGTKQRRPSTSRSSDTSHIHVFIIRLHVLSSALGYTVYTQYIDILNCNDKMLNKEKLKQQNISSVVVVFFASEALSLLFQHIN